jgi:hypothetical protein
MTFDLGLVAAIAHNVNRAFCQSIGDNSQPLWDDAPEWQQRSAIDGVNAIVQGVVTTPEQSHQNWSKHKISEGWVYGPVKDADAKTHPCLVPYSELPPEQRVKDDLFYAVVTTSLPFLR